MRIFCTEGLKPKSLYQPNLDIISTAGFSPQGSSILCETKAPGASSAVESPEHSKGVG